MFQETTKPLLRPRQTEELKEEAKRLREILSAPPHIANRIEDRGQLTKNLRAAEHDLLTQAPKPYAEGEIDVAKSRADALKEEMLVGMPTQEEMRRNPPGAVDKHRLWEKRNKPKLNEWKNIELRLHQNGFGELPDATDLVNFERFRPSGGSQQLNMDNAQIAGRTQFGPEPGAGPAVVFSDAEVEFLKTSNPTVHARLPLLSNGERQIVKDFIGGVTTATAGPSVSFSEVLEEVTAHLPPNLIIDPVDVSSPKRKPRKPVSEERRKQLAENLAKGRETARRNREARKQEG